MKKLFVTILLLLAATSYASQKAITDTGEQVILNSDGTWEYYGNAQKPAKIIETIKKKFERPRNSSFLLKSIKNKSAYWINTNKWSFHKAKDNPQAEYQFQLKGKDLYAMTIAEGVEIPIETLTNIALDNARSVAPDTKIVRQEYRVVNGNKVIYMEMNGTLQGVKFTYLGYYYSDTSGSIQLIAYTATSVVDKYKTEINDFLNGLVTQ
ncbi:hypothetical protein ES705_24345 [subsurface metagenome]